MTEYVIKEIGHQWIVYADRLSIGACADENEALQLVIEDSAAKARIRNFAGHNRIIKGTSNNDEFFVGSIAGAARW